MRIVDLTYLSLSYCCHISLSTATCDIPLYVAIVAYNYTTKPILFIFLNELRTSLEFRVYNFAEVNSLVVGRNY